MLHEPWAHDARGAELDWQASNDPSEYGRKLAAEHLLAWRLRDGLRRQDAAAAAGARTAMHDYVRRRVGEGLWQGPGLTLNEAAQAGIDAGDLDGAATDLCFWLPLPLGTGDGEIRSNVSQLIYLASKFLAAPGGSAHPRAAEIREGCLRAATVCYTELSRDLQARVLELSRGASGEQAGAEVAPPAASWRMPGDRISSAQLASWGRFQLVGEDQSGIKTMDSLDLVRALAQPIWMSEPDARAAAVAELARHAARGEWEAVGAWKFVRDFLDDEPGTRHLIDGGLAAVRRMRVTNLSIHLSAVDGSRYQELTGGPVPNDGFFGPPVFDSQFGPSRQYYLDSAVAAAAQRSIARLRHAPGTAPSQLVDAARAFWDFGQLIYRGPLVVNPDIAFERSAVRAAVSAATNADHVLFMNGVADAVADPANGLREGYAAVGGARFAEDYLVPQALTAPGFRGLLDAGLTWLLRCGEPGLAVSPQLLTPIQRERLEQLRASQ